MPFLIRNVLVNRLQEDDKFGQQRINELSDFLLNYVRQQLQSDDPDIKDFALAQRWIALAYTRSNQATRELALALSSAYHKDRADLIRLASLVETLAEPLGRGEEFQPLLIYARGMGNFAGGNLEAAKNELGKVIGKGNEINVAGIRLPIPEQIRAKNLLRRHFIQYLGFVSAGLAVVAIAGRLDSPQTTPDSPQTTPDSPQTTPDSPQTTDHVQLVCPETPIPPLPSTPGRKIGIATVYGFPNDSPLTGKGVMIFPDRKFGGYIRYDGELKNGRYSGCGSMTRGNGDRYVGQFDNNSFQGTGKYIYKNGCQYVGEIKKNQFDGQGTWISKDGSLERGIWQQGKLQGSNKAFSCE